jgi:hypothetical protein
VSYARRPTGPRQPPIPTPTRPTAVSTARRLRRWTDAEGGWNIQGRSTPGAGALFNAALDPIIDEVFRTARREGRHESRDAYALPQAQDP